MSTRTLKTTFMWHDSTGCEIECDALVEYDTYAGFEGDRINPPEAARVEIVGVTLVNSSYSIPAYAIDEDAVADDCMEDWRNAEIDDAERAAEYRDDDARDDRMMERWA